MCTFRMTQANSRIAQVCFWTCVSEGFRNETGGTTESPFHAVFLAFLNYFKLFSFHIFSTFSRSSSVFQSSQPVSDPPVLGGTQPHTCLYVGFVVHTVVVGQIFSEYLLVPPSVSFHQCFVAFIHSLAMPHNLTINSFAN
jgi:hypothetical protein